MISSVDLELLREMNEFSELLIDTKPDILQSYIDNLPHQGPLSGFNYDYDVDADGSASTTSSLRDQRDQCESTGIGSWPQ